MEENKMGVMPIDKLIISMSLPIMISMLVQALYNIVDSIFVAMISENALTAVSMAFPIQNLMIAVGVGTAVGVNALLARSLGEKDTEKVNKVAENAVFLILVSYLLFLIIGLFFAEPFFRSQTDPPALPRSSPGIHDTHRSADPSSPLHSRMCRNDSCRRSPVNSRSPQAVSPC